jgi:hypothetical protein
MRANSKAEVVVDLNQAIIQSASGFSVDMDKVADAIRHELTKAGGPVTLHELKVELHFEKADQGAAAAVKPVTVKSYLWSSRTL